MANIEALTVLAIIEAEDRASGMLGGIFGSIGRVADAFKAAGAAAEESGKLQDAGLLEGATAAERLSNAETKLSAAQTEAYDTSRALRDAQIELSASLDENGKATDTTAAAQARLRQATLDNTIASGNLRDAQLAQSAASKEVEANTNAVHTALGTASTAMVGVGIATAMASGYSVKMAGDFQAQTQVLVSGAGVQQNQIDGVRSSLLKMSVDTGTATKDLSTAFFNVNSRLGDVNASTQAVQAAAEIAKAHMADLGTVATALANTMNAYGKSAGNATQVSNVLGVAVERGGMSFQNLASSLSTVLPIASSMGIKLPEVAGALAVMTQQGMSANQATQNLSHTIQHISGPTATMLSTWNQMGLTQKQVADALSGPGGLHAALDLITKTAESKVGPSGQVVIDTFKHSQDAAASLTTMLQNMTPQARTLAEEFQNGAIGQTAYTKAARAMGAQSGIQATQFLTLMKASSGFNDALKAGKPGFANFDALLKASYGDQTSMNTALLLGNDHSKKWTQITNEAAAAGKNANGSIQGWSATQETLNFKMAQAKAALSAASIQLGTALIPAVTSLVKMITPWLTQLAGLIEHHQTLAKILVAVGLGLGAVGVGLKTVLGMFNLFKGTKEMITGISTALDKWQIGEKIASSWSTVSSTIGDAVTAVKGWTIWQDIASAGSKVWAGVTWLLDAAMSALPIIAIVAGIIALVAGIIYAYNHFKWFHDFVNMVWNGIKEGVKALADFFVGAWNGIVNTITAVWNGILGFFKKWWPLLLVIFALPIAILIGIWNRFHTEIMDAVKTVWGWIKDFLALMWEGIKITANQVWGLIKLLIITPMQWVWKVMKEGWDLMAKGISITFNQIKGVAEFIWKGIKAGIIQPVQEVLNFLSGFGSSVWNFIVGAFNNILKWSAQIGSWFINIGTDIVNGIINGINGAASYLFQGMENLANGALKAAKSILGISSPSKRFADEMGKWIPHGVAMGVVMHTQTAVDAVKKMAGALPQAISMQGALNIGMNGIGAAGTVYGTGLGLGATAGGNGQINLNVDLRGAVVAGDRGIEDLTNKIGAGIAQRILPQAGVRFH